MLNKLSLKMKLVAGFGLLLAILVALGFASYRTIVRIDEAGMEVDRKTQEKDLVSSIATFAMMESSGSRGFMLAGEEKMLERDERGKREIKQALETLVPKVQSDTGKRLYADLERSHDAYRALVDREIQLHREGKIKRSSGSDECPGGSSFGGAGECH